jgi:hypothetical protein
MIPDHDTAGMFGAGSRKVAKSPLQPKEPITRLLLTGKIVRLRDDVWRCEQNREERGDYDRMTCTREPAGRH